MVEKKITSNKHFVKKSLGKNFLRNLKKNVDRIKGRGSIKIKEM